MKFIKTYNTDAIDQFRKELYQRFSAPLDGMWEVLYIASAQTYFVESQGKNIGYCCIDEEDSLLQIFLSEPYQNLMGELIGALIDLKLIAAAKLSSMEPISFNACLFHSKYIKANTFCFQYANDGYQGAPLEHLELAKKEDIPAIKRFLKEQIEFDDNFGYTENLVRREEQYMIKESDLMIATGECRRSDSQIEVADLGVIVNRHYRRKGLATKVLRHLAQKAEEAKRKPICSTTVDNIASKKAIEKAGFYCSHIIFDIKFDEKIPEK